MPWWGAVLTALVLTAAGALLNELTSKALGLPFQVLYTIGCVLAVTFVRRRSLFGPMVQPPLIMIIVAGVVLALFAGASGGLAAKALAIGPALIGNFPVMAIATVLTVVIGAIRLILQRKPRPDEDEDFPPAARAVRREPSGREDREPPRREPAPRPAGARSRPAPPPARDRERPDRDRQQPPPPPRQVPPGRGMRTGEEMMHRFHRYPEAVHNAAILGVQCAFDL
ncbi:DUF6542 domain-containing protein, partial [Kutzneria sp. NPDC051319]|uniref:DUF6542 domain-containing protein n=1 Tax=Kutzneria sp. NPDC051319 TaxID=3155047 RepID=UPI0034201102